MKTAAESPLDWFFELHQPEVVKSAEYLLTKYPEADKDVVIIGAWLHDLGHFAAKTLEDVDKVKPNHHLVGSEMAEKLLTEYDLPREMIDKIKRCILCHRALPEYTPETIEEKIVAVADTLSHFESVFYLAYFKVYPNDSLDNYVKTQKGKLSRDWRDLALLPEAQDLVRVKYETILGMLNSYKEKSIIS
jgi:putative nucleotidyltransferase with HDIG domain